MSNSYEIINQLFLDWDELLQDFNIHQATAKTTFTQIVEAYSNPNRFYHKLEHIHHVLAEIRSLESQTKNSQAVKLAAWFHDIVYDTKAKDNEEKSANYAVELLSSLSVPPNVIRNVEHLILTTKNHQASPNDYDAQILLDADLAILGSKKSEYNQYTQAIRQEYIWVPEAEYFAARKKVLEKFMQRKNIYFTQLMQQAKEQTARNNIKAEIEKMRLIYQRLQTPNS